MYRYDPKPGRVLMTADAVGGVWTYSLELARALSDYGIQTSLAVMGAPLTAGRREEAGRIPDIQLHEGEYKLEWMEDSWADVERAGAWLLDLEEKLRPEIIHLNGFAHASLPWKSPKIVVGHSCVLSWWDAVYGGPAPAYWDAYRRIVAGGLFSSDIVVSPSKAMMWMLYKHYGEIPSGRVVYNGRNPRVFCPGRKEEIILMAGRLWDEAKNLRTVIRAAPKLSWPVYAAGEDRGEMPSGSPIRSLGQLSASSLSAWFARASIYVLPALYEPFGYTPLEAALCGCALVLGNIPSLREIWDGAAMFVEPRDEEDFRGAVEILISKPGLRREMAARARSRALEFTPSQMAAGYLAIYREVLEGWHLNEGYFRPRQNGIFQPKPRSLQ
ncbi:MAG: glycosyltransferase family 4 protein [Syntrophales bacterium]|nr:glycosyltransferase family 4 protein [Syntrophales bacterium]